MSRFWLGYILGITVGWVGANYIWATNGRRNRR